MPSDFNPTRVPVGGTVRSVVQPNTVWTVVPDGTYDVPGHVWVSDLRYAAVRDPGRHADPRRVADESSYEPLADWERELLGYGWPRADHRKPGPAN